MTQDNINHPKHYAAHGGHECIEYAQYFPFSLGCAYKYVWRAGEKEELGKTLLEKQAEDYEKALWYVEQWNSFNFPLPRPSAVIFNKEEELRAIEDGFTTGLKRSIIHQFHLLLRGIYFEKPTNYDIEPVANEIIRLLEYATFSTKAWIRAYGLASKCETDDRNLLAEFYHEGAMWAYEKLKGNDK